MFALAAKAAASSVRKPLPLAYTLGAGHVRFFFGRLGWLADRHLALVEEMRRRRFRVNFPDAASRWRTDAALQEVGWWMSWEPDTEAFRINRARIAERGPKNPVENRLALGAGGFSRAGCRAGASVFEGPPATTGQDFQACKKRLCWCSFFVAFSFRTKDNHSTGTGRGLTNKQEIIMSQKTYTRKTNAIAAAHRDMSKLDQLMFSVGQFEIEAVGKDGAWSAKITLINAKPGDLERCAETLPAHAFDTKNETPEHQESNMLDDTSSKTDADQTNTEATTKRGRAPSLAGRFLFPAKFDDDGKAMNTRKVGSHGHCSMQIILDNPGIKVEDYLKAGGRSNDLRWDLEHGNCTATETNQTSV